MLRQFLSEHPYFFFIKFVTLFIFVFIPTTHCSPTIAIVDFQTQPTSIRSGIDYEWFQLPEDSIQNFKKDVITELTATKRFQLVSEKAADEAKASLNEKDMNLNQLAKLSIQLNADFLIQIVIRLQGATLVQKKQTYNDRIIQDLFGTVRVELNVYNPKSHTMKVNQSISEEGLLGSGTPPKLFEQLEDVLVQKIVDKIELAVIPIEIFKVKEDVVYLNRGQEGKFEVGSVFSVLKKKSCETAAKRIGTIEVTDVYRTFSKAKVISGKGFEIGDACRIQQ